MDMSIGLELATFIIAPIVFIGGGIWLIIKIDDKLHLTRWQLNSIGLVIVVIMILFFWLVDSLF
ncbi:MAG: hypothetical protein JKX68_01060 [Flavobacteriales bacterium]|nr:hypothetical protein [Flavobacteriales bacterium]